MTLDICMPKHVIHDVKTFAALLARWYAPQHERSEFGWLITRHACTTQNTGSLHTASLGFQLRSRPNTYMSMR